MEPYFSFLKSFLPPAGVAVFVILLLFATNRLLARRFRERPDKTFFRQLAMVILSLLGILAVVVVLPVGDTLRGQILGLFGLVVSAAIALSSTTFLGNALAGIMLRSVRSFRAGDFIRVGENFGRVSGRGLFHVEIQAEDRDLVTLPNLFVATSPVKVSHASGTIVSAEVTLGYDTPRTRVEALLLRAARAASLQDPFVLIIALGDFSVLYRVSGLLEDVPTLLSVRSRLNGLILDSLHQASVEIVSPNFMNTRAVEDRAFIPRAAAVAGEGKGEVGSPESIVFDKADKAETVEKIKARIEAIECRLVALGREEEGAKEKGEAERLKRESADLERKLELLLARVEEYGEEEADR